MKNQEPKSKPADSKQRRGKGLSVQRIVRHLHRVFANLMGYFWLPCPICHEPFGRHEWTDTSVGVLTDVPGVTKGVCTACAEKYKGNHIPGAMIHVDPETGESHCYAVRSEFLPNMKDDLKIKMRIIQLEQKKPDRIGLSIIVAALSLISITICYLICHLIFTATKN
jgi:hypothetical protein